MGLVMAYGRVNTGESGTAGGGGSTLTVRVDSAVVAPFVAATFKTYSPLVENVAVVVAARGSANVTVPGPETLVHAAPAVRSVPLRRARRHHDLAAAPDRIRPIRSDTSCP